MDPFRDPLLANGCWITLLAAVGLFLLARHDARFGDTRIARRVAIGLFVIGLALGAADLCFTSIPLPTIY